LATLDATQTTIVIETRVRGTTDIGPYGGLGTKIIVMRHFLGIIVACGPLLGACDSREPIAECIDGWQTRTVVSSREWDGFDAGPVVAVDDGYAYGFTAHGVARRVDADGSNLWGVTAEPHQGMGIAGLARTVDEGIVVAARVFDSELPSMTQLWVGEFSADGVAKWSHLLGSAHSGWNFDELTADVLVHPDGGYVVSWHDSLADGAAPRMMLARLDASDGVLWSTSHALAPDSKVEQWWSEGAADLLPDGSIVQLTANGERLRLVHTAADGTAISDVVLEDLPAWPMDLRVLPDGAVLVLANHSGRAMVLEVDPAGAIVQEHVWDESDPFLGAMQWDPVLEVLYLGGSLRDEANRQRPWTLLVDRNGDELASYIDPDGGDWISLGAAALPGGGFAASRNADTLLIETTTPCDEG
jgi:hypothetical protein